MPTLTRRRSPDAREECWQIFYGDIRVGTIAKRVGIPNDQPRWGWTCGFYPGSHPGECTGGAAATLDEARAAFEAAWRIFLGKRTEADFQEWRDQQEWTERKYAMQTRGERMPSQKPSPLMTCACGQVFDSHRPEETVVHVLHITGVTAVQYEIDFSRTT
jgi:hypothetical protein